MELIILTGLSGSGKSRALDTLEDIGYYCVDNMPTQLLPKFAELCLNSGGKLSKVAIVIDIRGQMLFTEIDEIKALKENENFDVKIIYLDAQISSIIRRYKETRRLHPLQNSISKTIESAITEEKSILKDIKIISDKVIDTSNLSSSNLRDSIIVAVSGERSKFYFNFVSFGFKYGILTEGDMIFDARMLPNPFYIEELKYKTGQSEDVFNYVYSFEDTIKYTKQIEDILDFATNLFVEEGKGGITVGIGCTGGKHRSVSLARELSKRFSEKGFQSTASHRDILK